MVECWCILWKFERIFLWRDFIVILWMCMFFYFWILADFIGIVLCLTVDLAFALVCLILLVFTCFLQFGEILSEQVWIFQSKVQGLLFDFCNVIETDNGTDISMCWWLLIPVGAKLWWFVMFQSGYIHILLYIIHPETMAEYGIYSI